MNPAAHPIGAQGLSDSQPTASGEFDPIDLGTVDSDETASKPTKAHGLSRYATIIVSVALFLVFDMGVLVMNFFISAQIAEDAVAVNLAGRQRMLSQRMVKTLLLTENRVNSELDPSAPYKELKLTVDLFDSSFRAFVDGGQVKGTDGKPVIIHPVDTPQGQAILNKADAIWSPFRKLLGRVTADQQPNLLALASAISYGSKHNLSLLKLMNALTNERESVASARASNLRMIQAAGIGLALINFVIILFHFIRKLRAADDETERHARDLEHSNAKLAETTEHLEAAKRETDEILETVNEGLFLIDEHGRIGDQHSRDLEKILPAQQFAGETLAGLLRPLLSDKDYAMTLDYLKLLFQPRLKEKMLLNVNPLEEVEVKLSRPIKGSHQRVLSFSFNRVRQGKLIRHVLVSVHDVTERVTLARELEASQERAKEQMELLFSIVHIEPLRVTAFIDETRSRIANVNELLRTAEIGASGNLRSVVDAIFRQIHAIKGDAAMLGLGLYENTAHDFEDELNRLRSQASLQGQDFVPLALRLDELRRYLSETSELIEKISGFSNIDDPDNQASQAVRPSSLIDALQDLVGQVSSSLGRQANLAANDFDPRLIPAQSMHQIKDILIQLIRNAVSHGIEAPQARRLKNKPEAGQLQLSTRQGQQGLEICLRDDGAGIQVERIREKARAAQLRSDQQLQAMSSQEVVSLIFEPGFSTAEQVDEHAGRGVGMDIVRDEVAKLGGRLRLAFATGRFTEFTLIVPPTEPNEVA